MGTARTRRMHRHCTHTLHARAHTHVHMQRTHCACACAVRMQVGYEIGLKPLRAGAARTAEYIAWARFRTFCMKLFRVSTGTGCSMSGFEKARAFDSISSSVW